MIDLLIDEFNNEKAGGDEEALALIGAHTADFVASRDIGSIVFIDTAARNARHPISAAMKQLYPDRSVDYYFVNPAGLVEKELFDVVARNDEIRTSIDSFLSGDKHMVEMCIGELSVNLCHASETYIDIEDGRKQPGTPQQGAAIRQNLSDNFERLNGIASNHANKRTLIFDQCLHLGLTLRATKESLENAFPDRTFYTGVVDQMIEFTDYKPDLTVFPPDSYNLIGCAYFGRYGGGSQLGSLGSDRETLRNPLQVASLRRLELARICSQLDYS